PAPAEHEQNRIRHPQDRREHEQSRDRDQQRQQNEVLVGAERHRCDDTHRPRFDEIERWAGHLATAIRARQLEARDSALPPKKGDAPNSETINSATERQSARGTPDQEVRPVRILLALSILATLGMLVLAAPASASDPTGPQVELVSPAEGEGFYQGEKVQAGWGCFPGTLGWPVIMCDGDVGLGDWLDTSSVGPHPFSVHALDYSGAETTVTHTYTVFDVIAPTASIVTPAAGAEYPIGTQLYASYSCDDGPGGSGIVGCIGTYPNGYPRRIDRRGPAADPRAVDVVVAGV